MKTIKIFYGRCLGDPDEHLSKIEHIHSCFSTLENFVNVSVCVEDNGRIITGLSTHDTRTFLNDAHIVIIDCEHPLPDYIDILKNANEKHGTWVFAVYEEGFALEKEIKKMQNPSNPYFMHLPYRHFSEDVIPEIKRRIQILSLRE
jgi:hypothetical protein